MEKDIRKGWDVFTTIEKYNNREDLEKGVCDIKEVRGNILLIEGVRAIWERLAGYGDPMPAAFNESNSHIGIGGPQQVPEGDAGGGELDQATNEATGLRADTDADAPDNVLNYQPMMTGFPVIEDNRMTFKSEFSELDANGIWHEWTVANGDSNAAINLNLKNEPMGEKFEGAIWRITVEIRLT